MGRTEQILDPTNSFLAELTRQVRGDTLRLLDAVPESRLTWAPPGISNHLPWHPGHALWLQDVLCVEPVTGLGELPAGWADTFGQHCRPVATTTAWPPRAQVAGRLGAQLERMFALFDQDGRTRPAQSDVGNT